MREAHWGNSVRLGWIIIHKVMDTNKYTQFDWARDRWDVARWAEEEERLLNGIDGRMRTSRTNKLNKKNHRNYA